MAEIVVNGQSVFYPDDASDEQLLDFFDKHKEEYFKDEPPLGTAANPGDAYAVDEKGNRIEGTSTNPGSAESATPLDQFMTDFRNRMDELHPVLRTAAEMAPGSGEATAGLELAEGIAQDDIMKQIFAGVGLVPLVGGVKRVGGAGFKAVKKLLNIKTPGGHDIFDETALMSLSDEQLARINNAVDEDPALVNEMHTWMDTFGKSPIEALDEAIGIKAETKRYNELWDKVDEGTMVPINDDHGRIVGFRPTTAQERARRATQKLADESGQERIVDMSREPVPDNVVGLPLSKHRAGVDVAKTDASPISPEDLSRATAPVENRPPPQLWKMRKQFPDLDEEQLTRKFEAELERHEWYTENWTKVGEGTKVPVRDDLGNLHGFRDVPETMQAARRAEIAKFKLQHETPADARAREFRNIGREEPVKDMSKESLPDNVTGLPMSKHRADIERELVWTKTNAGKPLFKSAGTVTSLSDQDLDLITQALDIDPKVADEMRFYMDELGHTPREAVLEVADQRKLALIERTVPPPDNVTPFIREGDEIFIEPTKKITQPELSAADKLKQEPDIFRQTPFVDKPSTHNVGDIFLDEKGLRKEQGPKGSTFIKPTKVWENKDHFGGTQHIYSDFVRADDATLDALTKDQAWEIVKRNKSAVVDDDLGVLSSGDGIHDTQHSALRQWRKNIRTNEEYHATEGPHVGFFDPESGVFYNRVQADEITTKAIGFQMGMIFPKEFGGAGQLESLTSRKVIEAIADNMRLIKNPEWNAELVKLSKMSSNEIYKFGQGHDITYIAERLKGAGFPNLAKIDVDDMKKILDGLEESRPR